MDSVVSNRARVVINLFWRFLESSGNQVVCLIVSIVLARNIEPKAFGTIALVTVLRSIMQVMVDSSMGSALIQKKNTDDCDFSSVFYFNVFISLVLYAGMYLGAPYIATFYNNDELLPITRILSITLIIGAIRNVQQARIARDLQFKKLFLATICATVGAAILGIIMAYRGYGVWALVYQQLFNAFVGTIIIWLVSKWRPRLIFSFVRLKGLFSFGWKLFISSLIYAVYNNLRQLLIGKIYTPADLAFYNRGSFFPEVIVGNINNSINSVLFPVLSKEQDDRIRIKEMTRRAIKTSSFFIAPAMVILAACAKSLVLVLLTDKWLPCVHFLQIFCFVCIFYPIATANLNAIKAIGRSDYYLRLEILKRSIALVLLFSTIWVSVEAMALSLLLSSIISVMLNAYPNKKLLNYSLIEQVKDIYGNFVLAILIGIIIFPIGFCGLAPIFILLIQATVGFLLFVGISFALRIDTFFYLVSTLSSLVGLNKLNKFHILN